MRTIKAIAVLLAFFAIMTANATEYSDAANTCLSDSTNGKDRKALARWFFLGMAAHPEIRALSNATDASLDQANQDMAIY